MLCSAFSQSLQAQDSIVYLEWTDDPLRSMVVNWVTEMGGVAELQYRPEGAVSWSAVSGTTNQIPGSSRLRSSVPVTGLSPGTSYEFQVAGDVTIYRFRTMPSSVETPLKFIMAGDLYGNPTERTAAEQQQIEEMFVSMSQQAASFDPWFAVWGGDLAHANADPDDAYLWFQMMRDWFVHMRTSDGYLVPIVAAIGNNDVPLPGYGFTPDDAIFFHAFFSFPGQQWSPKRSYGILDFGEYLSIITLDTDHTTRVSGMQTNWLRNRLQERDGQMHVFPVYHVAGWPSYRSFRDVLHDEIRDQWQPLFQQNEIRMVFEHHCHIYKRTKPLRECVPPITNELHCDIDERGVRYLGGGSFASLPRELNSAMPSEGEWYHETYEDETNNFVLVEISETYRKTTAYDVNGNVLDEYTDITWLPAPMVYKVEKTSVSSFTARWDAVEGATRHRIDVSKEEDFSSYLPGFQDRNMGTDTSVEVTGIDPHETYYYRVRAATPTVLSENSDVIRASIVPDPPSALEPGNVQATSFTARWESEEDVDGFRLDVSVQEDFSSTLEGYDNRPVGLTSSFDVTGLLPGTNYYYRVRAESFDIKSQPSSAIQVATIPVSATRSELSVSIRKALANGQQESLLSVIIRDPDGNELEGVPVQIDQGESTSAISVISDVTDENGEALFSVTHEEDVEVTYQARVGEVVISGEAVVEFLDVDGPPELGDNFPNPFQIHTTIPVTVPRNMYVRLIVANVLGGIVQTLVNEELSAGHYEISFNSRDLASGTYFYRLITDERVQTEKMMLVK
ncbi:MAG: fibronectin type III domain-containing protein [Balneolaceae bacterium]